MINELSIEDYSGLAAKLKDCLSDDNYDDDGVDDDDDDDDDDGGGGDGDGGGDGGGDSDGDGDDVAHPLHEEHASKTEEAAKE